MRSLVTAAALVVTAAGCGSSAGKSSATRVLADKRGACPLRTLDHHDLTKLRAPCTVGRRENAVAGQFKRPGSLWGVAYAFNCGPGKRQFRWHVGSPGGDVGVPNTGTWTVARHGKGFQMMTPVRLAALQGIPRTWASVLDIEIVSGCTWHVVSVQGNREAVAAAVPAIPAYRNPHAA